MAHLDGIRLVRGIDSPADSRGFDTGSGRPHRQGTHHSYILTAQKNTCHLLGGRTALS